MADFRLKKIHIQNFKVFEDFELDFANDDLLVFGGPNGYGKTTVFDAIELALTGDIARFQNIEANAGCGDILVARDQNKPVEVELTVTKDNSDIRIFRKLPVTKMSKNEKKSGNFKNLWTLFIKEGEIDVKDPTQGKLEEILGQKELHRYYNLFYYIQQEDTSHFFKKSEKDRLKEIARLFGTDKEEGEQKKLEEAKGKISKIIKDIKTEIDKKKASLRSESDRTVVSDVLFAPLLPWLKKEWDRESLSFGAPETKDKYLLELKRIQQLVAHREEFLENKEFLDGSRQIEIIKAVLVGASFFDRFEEIETRSNEKSKLSDALEVLKGEKFESDGELLDTDFLNKVFTDFDPEGFTKDRLELIQLQGKRNSTNRIVNSLVEIRADFLKQFKEADVRDIQNGDCPLCGFNWENTEKLIFEIDKKTEFFVGMLDSEEKAYREFRDQFISKFVDPLKKQIVEKLATPDYQISAPLFSKLQEVQKQKQLSINFLKWLKTKEIDYEDLLITGLGEDVDNEVLKDKEDKLVRRIELKAPAKGEDYQRKYTEYNFSDVFETFFMGKSEYLREIDHKKIGEKCEYIEHQYFQALETIRQEVEELERKSNHLSSVEKKIDDSINIYKKQIGQYRRRIIGDIEIPFFIYCGKILQTIRKTNTTGVFIKDPSSNDELKNIRFVTDWESDHDVINTTSSGQLAGIVIALTLAMNRVYSKGLASIFIDDPVQTMDDLNMVSLVELLRNDFADKQLFLSTHEREIENYILYKYMKYGRSVGRVNCMTQEPVRHG